MIARVIVACSFRCSLYLNQISIYNASKNKFHTNNRLVKISIQQIYFAIHLIMFPIPFQI